jgi:hypothetical protein
MSYVRSVAVCLALCGLTASAAMAQAPTLNPPAVSGANINFSWSATAGATSYNLLATIVPGGPPLGVFNVGGVTSYAATAPATGVYYVKIQALPGGETSNEVQVVVTSLVPAPAAPVGLQAFRNGTGVLISWQPGGGGPAAGYILRVGTSPGGSELGAIPTGATGLAVGGGVPPGTYYLAVSAVNAGGASGEATTVLAMPAGGACDAPPAPALTTTAWGSFLTAHWSAVPGAVSYLLTTSGPVNTTVPFPGGTTNFLYPSLPQGSWNFGIQAQFSCGAYGAVGGSNLVVDGASLKMEPRVPDPPPGQALGTPSYASSVVFAVAAAYPGELRNSCGNTRWLFRLVNELRKRDKRWGLNWKRANVGDMSQDIVTFNWSSDPDEGTLNTRVYDVIAGHCGSNPGPNFDEKTILGSTGAKWTLLPYIQAGYAP